MSDVAIRVENLSKVYRIGGPQERYKTLRDTIAHAAKAPVQHLRRLGQPAAPEETVWALKDLSLEVKHGEVLGIIGRNGSGKTTLLKVLSRITDPTEGSADVYGRVGSLLEVGTGFHPELTGRENIYLNGAILGMKRVEIDGKFNEIVEFAEVERFLDTPVKRYSSGMHVRLAFAVAAHLEPEILLVDEVLAVGDIAFQKKCLGKMDEVAREGRTVLFVSHNMPVVESLCTRAVLLEGGRGIQNGPPPEVIREYMELVGSRGSPDLAPRRGSAGFDLTRLVVPGQGQTDTVPPSSPCRLETVLLTAKSLDDCYINLHIDDLQGRHCIHLRTDYDALFPHFPPGRHPISVDISSLNLEGGTYLAWFRLVSKAADVRADSEKLVLRVPRLYERFEAVGAMVAVQHSWQWDSWEEEASRS